VLIYSGCVVGRQPARAGRFECGGAEVAEGRVSAAGVVPTFDVLEYRLAGGGVGRPGLPVQQFGFDGGEERFGDGVVPALPASAD
jgi:hypothetical protein